MLIVLLRTLILFFVVMISMRIMGKRQLGELQPYELVATIMISELASLPMQDTRIPLLHGVIPIITLLVIQILISLLQLRVKKSRVLFDGKPSIVINKGKVVLTELRNQLFTISDLIEELRINGYFSIEDIEYAILETNGQLSIIPKASSEPVTRRDMNIKTNSKNLPVSLILDGKLNIENLKIINKTEEWLFKELAKYKINNVSDVAIAMLDSEDKLFIQQYNENKENIGEADI